MKKAERNKTEVEFGVVEKVSDFNLKHSKKVKSKLLIMENEFRLCTAVSAVHSAKAWLNEMAELCAVDGNVTVSSAVHLLNI
jgi:predicted HTH domain antitoxin